MKARRVILRLIDGRVKCYQRPESLGISGTCAACIRVIPQINPE